MTPLFSSPDSFTLRGMDMLFRVLDEVMPMNSSQKRDLPMACRDLSALLTTDRKGIDRPYWTSPRLTSAYLRYFLPWNLIRLSSLLPSLDLGRIPENPLLLDMGSGPLTLPIALWLARPDLRQCPVTLVASDTTPHILDLGHKIFDRLRTLLAPESPWIIRTMRSSAAQAPYRLYAKPGSLWMITMGNVLNEMEEKRSKPGYQIADRMRDLLEKSSNMLCENGLILSIEPGTRQGGRLISHLRKNALGGMEEESTDTDLTALALREEQKGRDLPEEDEFSDWESWGLPPLFTPLSPCPHTGPCPMLGRHVTAWCHMNAPAPHAPEHLKELSARAGLDKDSVSLSFLLLRKLRENEQTEQKKPAERTIPARIISDAFIVPGCMGRSRYACSPLGLALIPSAAHLPQGALCMAYPTQERDRKSHAIILSLEKPGTSPHDIKQNDRFLRQNKIFLHHTGKEAQCGGEKTQKRKKGNCVLSQEFFPDSSRTQKRSGESALHRPPLRKKHGHK